tara:strand:+ start:27 stop:368 length:342 start_codon:yes stop_codon:yes gene_type:complete
MGINSTGVAYNFGQLGSGFTDENGTVTPPSGKVIVAITFIGETQLAALVADTTQGNDAAFFSHTAAVAGNGSGAAETDNGTKFPAGLTIYGRWTSVRLTGASTDHGIICYYGY